jgi:hypothetical protein
MSLSSPSALLRFLSLISFGSYGSILQSLKQVATSMTESAATQIIPPLVKEILFAPDCAPEIATLFEVATVYQSTGQHQVGVMASGFLFLLLTRPSLQ